MMTRLACFLCLVGILQVHGRALAQNERVLLDRQEMTLEQVFNAITRQLHYNFFYSDDELDASKRVTIDHLDTRVEELLQLVLDPGMGFQFIGKTIVLTPRLPQSRVARVDTVSGVVKHGDALLPGASVRLKGTSGVGVATDAEGRFRLFIPGDSKQVLVVSFIGMTTREILVSGSVTLVVSLEEAIEEMGEVVVMGMFNRRAESFTGRRLPSNRKISSASATRISCLACRTSIPRLSSRRTSSSVATRTTFPRSPCAGRRVSPWTSRENIAATSTSRSSSSTGSRRR